MKTAMERFEAVNAQAAETSSSMEQAALFKALAKSFEQELDGRKIPPGFVLVRAARILACRDVLCSDKPDVNEAHNQLYWSLVPASPYHPWAEVEAEEKALPLKDHEPPWPGYVASPTPPATGQNPVAIVVDNIQQDGTIKVQTPPNMTINLGTELFRHVPVSLPEGFTLVPKEPTWNMIQSANFRQVEGAETLESSSVEYALWVEVYKAILAASPTPKEEGK